MAKSGSRAQGNAATRPVANRDSAVFSTNTSIANGTMNTATHLDRAASAPASRGRCGHAATPSVKPR